MLSTAVVFLAATALAHTPMQTQAQTQYLDAPNDYSGYRFCELVPIWIDGLFSVASNIKLTIVEVYTTVGMNSCVQSELETLNENALAKQFKTFMFKIRGPK
jgi:hypothetical protein